MIADRNEQASAEPKQAKRVSSETFDAKTRQDWQKIAEAYRVIAKSL